MWKQDFALTQTSWTECDVSYEESVATTNSVQGEDEKEANGGIGDRPENEI